MPQQVGLNFKSQGITKQILEKYEFAPPTCPDMSGQPMDFKSCFTGFIPIIAGGLLGVIMLVIEIIADKSFGVDISKYYENVDADLNTVQMCHNCGIDLNWNN